MIERGYDKGKIHTYNRNDTKETKVTAIPAGHVLFATNLAGRGENYKVDAKYGLYVCITYLPLNQRVEEQALNRAARNGQPGSAQLIINTARLYNQLYPFVDNLSGIAAIKAARCLREQQRLVDLQQGKFQKLNLFDRLFTEIQRYITEKRGESIHQSIIDQIDELWSFQYAKLNELIENLGRLGYEKLQQAVKDFNLNIALTRLVDSPDSLYSIISQGLKTLDRDSPLTPSRNKRESIGFIIEASFFNYTKLAYKIR